jgi:hypothetical protein
MRNEVQAVASRMQVGRPEKLFDSRVGPPNNGVNPAVEPALYAVSPDGQRFLVSNRSATTNAEPLVVVMNRPALLRK